MKRFIKAAFALTLGVVIAGAFTMSKSQSAALDSNTTLSENAAIASISSEAAGTCCPTDVGLCIVGRVTVAHAYLLSGHGSPCP